MLYFKSKIHNILYILEKGGRRLKLEGIDEELMLYGMLFALCNRIQTIGDSQFEDITMKQHFMMVALSVMGEEAPTLKETGEFIGCSYQNVKRMATQLEQNGYLRIIQDEKDKRKLRLVATDKMTKLEQVNLEGTNQFMQEMYRGISKEELKMAIGTLKKMNHNLGGTIQ